VAVFADLEAREDCKKCNLECAPAQDSCDYKEKREVVMRHTKLTKAILATTAVLFVLAVRALPAHHGWTGYDDKNPLTLTGVVKDSGYENPHGFVDLETPDKMWRVVLAPPARMENRGLSREMIKTGAKVTVMGYPNKVEKSELRAERITINDKTIELR
jgi:hypothetical protein